MDLNDSLYLLTIKITKLSRQNSCYQKIPLSYFTLNVYVSNSCSRSWVPANQVGGGIILNRNFFWLCEHHETPILTCVDAAMWNLIYTKPSSQSPKAYPLPQTPKMEHFLTIDYRFSPLTIAAQLSIFDDCGSPDYALDYLRPWLPVSSKQ